uniref:hypothetical protein n=1 Tax=Actinoplanes sp. CA-084688 TaxID=3239901 RepID=UPI003F49A7D7
MLDGCGYGAFDASNEVLGESTDDQFGVDGQREALMKGRNAEICFCRFLHFCIDLAAVSRDDYSNHGHAARSADKPETGWPPQS